MPSLLKKSSNPAAIAVNNAGDRHEVVTDPPYCDNNPCKAELRSRPDYGESSSRTMEMNEENAKTSKKLKPQSDPGPELFSHDKDFPYAIEQIIGSGLFNCDEDPHFDRIGCNYCKGGSGEVYHCQGWRSLEEVNEDRNGNKIDFKLCPHCLADLYNEGRTRDNAIIVSSKSTEAENFWANPNEFSLPEEKKPWYLQPEQWKDHEKGTTTGYAVAVETPVKTATSGEMYISSIEFSPKNAMLVEKFSFTADKAKAEVFHKLTADDVVRQLASPAFRVSARIVVASEYEDMFKTLLSMVATVKPKPNIEPMINREITWAKEKLKKKDRVIWYLRMYRIALIKSLIDTIPAKVQKPVEASKTADTMPLQPQQPIPSQGQAPMRAPKKLKAPSLKVMLEQLLDKYKRELTAKGGDASFRTVISDYGWVKRQLEHFYSLPIPRIQNTVLTVQSYADLIREFSAAEQEWQEKAAALLKPHAEDRIFKKFSDGWAWWWLPRASCDDESKAMGHCGNSPMAGRKGISILSLREPVQHGGETLWYPHATFILHGEGDAGSLGEMKGRANEKPVAKYHPYIVELLKDSRIHAIVGGGYLPEHNFSLEDLTPEQRKEVAAANPNIGLTIKDYYETYGFDQKLTSRISTVLDLKNARFDPSVGFVVREWPNKDEFINDIGDDHAKEAWKFVETGEYDQSSPDGEEMADLLDEIEEGEDTVYNIGLALQYSYSVEIAQWYDETDGSNPFDPRSKEWVKQLIKDIYEIKVKPPVAAKKKENSLEEDPLQMKDKGGEKSPYQIPVIDKLYYAYISGGPDQDSIEELIDESIRAAIDGMENSTIEGDRKGGYLMVITPEQAINAASMGESGTRRYNVPDFDPPRIDVGYSWDDWSEERAVGTLRSIFLERPKRPEMERQRKIPYKGRGTRISKWLKNSLFRGAYFK